METTEKLLALREAIDGPIWWIGDSYEDQRDGEVAIHSPERGCIATIPVEWEDDGLPIESGIADAELMGIAPDLLDEVIQLREEIEAIRKINQALANQIEYLQEQIRFTPKD